MKLTIDRRTWRRGGIGRMDTDGGTSLLNDRGKMCCLGFVSIACGLKPEEIMNLSDPAWVARKTTITFPECMNFLVREMEEDSYSCFHENSEVCLRLMFINDDHNINDATREETLQQVFATVGWDVEFIN